MHTLSKMAVSAFAKHLHFILSPIPCPHSPCISLVYIVTVPEDPTLGNNHVCVWEH